VNRLSIEKTAQGTFVRGPVSSTIPSLVAYARASVLSFNTYKVVSDPFTSKFRTFGIQIIG
jgi:hypothetical protein